MTLKQFLHDNKYGDESLVGKLITLQNGEKLLVGDINVFGGVCDDCMSCFMDEEIEGVETIHTTSIKKSTEKKKK